MVNLPPPEPNDRPPISRPRDNDEAIAVTIALLSVGAILWWGWSRGQQFLAPVFSVPGVSDSEIADADDLIIPGAAEDDGLLRSDRSLFDTNQDETVARERRRAQEPIADNRDVVRQGQRDRTQPNPTIDGGGISPEEGVAPVVPNNATTPTEPATESAAEPLPALDISDISPDYWAYPYIVSLFDAGLLPDLPDGRLQPDKELTRAELAALLSSSFVGDGQPGQEATQFADVTTDFWAENAISQVVEAGYMVGFPDNTFRPNELVPRYQTLVTMASGLDLAPPGDVDGVLGPLQGSQDLPAWSRPQVAAAASEGIIVNHPDPQQLEPQQPTTRAEVIAFIHEALVARGELEPVDTPYSIPPR